MVSFLIKGHRQVVAVARKRRWWSQQLRGGGGSGGGGFPGRLTLIPVLRFSFARRSLEEMRGWGTIAAGDSGDFFSLSSFFFRSALAPFFLSLFLVFLLLSRSRFRVLRQLETRRRRRKLGLPRGSFCKVSRHAFWPLPYFFFPFLFLFFYI